MLNSAIKLIGLVVALTTTHCVSTPTYDDDLICRVLSFKIEMEENAMEDNYFMCQIETEQHMMYFLDLPDDFVAQHPHLEDGETIISIPYGKAVERHDDLPPSIEYPNDAQISIVHPLNRRLVTADRSRYKTIGRRNILVVRVTSLDSEVTLSKEVLGARILGLGEGAVEPNAVSQFNSCSFDKLHMVPAEGDGIVNGVYEMFLDRNVTQDSWLSYIEEFYVPMREQFGGDFTDRFDNVMFCLPPKANLNGNGWLAAAFIGKWATFYSDQTCSHLSIFMHELGHNLGLYHSGADTRAYADASGNMGFSQRLVGSPAACFNGQKNWWLNWFEDRRVENSGNRAWTGKLAAFTDYDETTEGEHVVLLKVGNYYLQYNKAEKFNRGTRGAQNLISITSIVPNGNSNLTGTLGLNTHRAKSVFYIEDFLGTGFAMVIEACDQFEGTPDYFTMSVHLENGIQTSYCRGGVQTIDSPTGAPTSTASQVPSAQPSDIPTTAPSMMPSLAPTAAPSISSSPSMMPSLAPTVAPSISSSPTETKVCEDNNDEMFWVETRHWHQWRTCAWLSKSTAWQQRLCNPYRYHAARDACPELCGVCSDHCSDDNDFSIQYRNRNIGCHWISIRPVMAERFCRRGNVANACRETCDTCSATENKVAQ